MSWTANNILVKTKDKTILNIDEIRLPEMPKDEVANAIVEYLSQCL